MKLTNADKKYLISIGANENEFEQIEQASRKTTYELNDTSNAEKYVIEGKVSFYKALSIIGRKKMLTGLYRSTYHRTACRYNDDCSKMIYFENNMF